MKIAIQAADLGSKRIDGTRIYIWNLLSRFGRIRPEDRFLIYHKNGFNPALQPEAFSNYEFKKLRWPLLWTQVRFAGSLWKDRPEALWMPFHNIPLVRPRTVRTTITIHDLAFKYFPDHFTRKDLWKLNFLADMAISHTDKIIAISEATKNDILKFYPAIAPEKIKVIHHGFNEEYSQKGSAPEEVRKVLEKYALETGGYLLYVGALQPRKNITLLVEAFERAKREIGGRQNGLKLVLAGEKAWLWERILERIGKSPFKKDIVLTGQVGQDELRVLYRQAGIFVFPSLYEGFGLPILEAFASGVPVIAAGNSSLPEVGGEAALYFDAQDAAALQEKIVSVLSDEALRRSMTEKGARQLSHFSWDKCAQETLDWIKT